MKTNTDIEYVVLPTGWLSKPTYDPNLLTEEIGVVFSYGKSEHDGCEEFAGPLHDPYFGSPWDGDGSLL